MCEFTRSRTAWVTGTRRRRSVGASAICAAGVRPAEADATILVRRRKSAGLASHVVRVADIGYERVAGTRTSHVGIHGQRLLAGQDGLAHPFAGKLNVAHDHFRLFIRNCRTDCVVRLGDFGRGRGIFQFRAGVPIQSR